MRLTLVVIFLCCVGFASKLAAAPGSDTVKISSLIRRMPRSEFVKEIGGAAVISDSMTDDLKFGVQTTLVCEPVLFEGTRALIEATIIGDSTRQINVFLPYIGHTETRLKVPFQMSDFVQGNLEVYNQLERQVEDDMGIPTVLTGTTFEYLDGTTQPIFGVFEQGMVHVTIVPIDHPLSPP